MAPFRRVASADRQRDVDQARPPRVPALDWRSGAAVCEVRSETGSSSSPYISVIRFA
jgi:hypothetical protein